MIGLKKFNPSKMIYKKEIENRKILKIVYLSYNLKKYRIAYSL